MTTALIATALTVAVLTTTMAITIGARIVRAMRDFEALLAGLRIAADDEKARRSEYVID